MRKWQAEAKTEIYTGWFTVGPFNKAALITAIYSADWDEEMIMDEELVTYLDIWLILALHNKHLLIKVDYKLQTWKFYSEQQSTLFCEPWRWSQYVSLK